MFLLRLKSIENLRTISPGEFGKLLGLDRVAEVKTLRSRISCFSSQGQAKQWSLELCKDWMEKEPEYCGALYVDGHVRIYNGNKTKLPARHVSRQKLCLRGMTDFWVNDFLGRPFFVVSKAVNVGLIKIIKEDILPELLLIVPNQPTQKQLAENRYLSRFMLVFDREGYSPEFIKEMWNLRIACCTYKKNVKDKWPIAEFKRVSVTLSHGESTEMYLAERGVFLNGKLWVREIRKLTECGHQTTIISTDFTTEIGRLSVAMFSRWGQENFFKYMMEHYGIDRLIEYELEDIDDTEKVINPEYRMLDNRIKSITGKLQRKQAGFMSIEVPYDMPESRRIKLENKKAEYLEDIDEMQSELQALRKQRSEVKKHILFSQLPEDQKFKSLASEKKMIINTVKMISYRAETCLVGIAREYISHKDEARNFVRILMKSDIDMEVDNENQILYVFIHNLSSRSLDIVAQKLCDELNKSETCYPATNLKLFYKLVSSNYT